MLWLALITVLISQTEKGVSIGAKILLTLTHIHVKCMHSYGYIIMHFMHIVL